ncbi:hypothetical protein LguiB_031195 [Lonicera macranthoides]
MSRTNNKRHMGMEPHVASSKSVIGLSSRVWHIPSLDFGIWDEGESISRRLRGIIRVDKTGLITVAHTMFNSPDTSNDPDFTFQPLADNLFEHDTSSGNLLALMKTIKNCEALLRKCLAEMMKKHEPQDQILCIIYEMLMHYAGEAVANHMKIPKGLVPLKSVSKHYAEEIVEILFKERVEWASHDSHSSFEIRIRLLTSNVYMNKNFELRIPISHIYMNLEIVKLKSGMGRALARRFQKRQPERGFSSHCCWNSTLESISEGITVIYGPRLGDQYGDSKYLAHVWRVGLQVEHEFERGEIEKAISG